MVRCVQCDTELVAPVRSEYWSDDHALTFGIARNAAPVFRPRSPLPTIPTSRGAAIILGFAQQLRRLGDIRRNPPRLVFREQLGRRIAGRQSRRLVSEIR